MKILEGMDLDDRSILAEATTVTKSNDLPPDENSTPHLSMLNGIKYPDANSTDGNMSLESSPNRNLDENAIGFEVESYSDSISDLSHEIFSGNMGNSSSNELNQNTHSLVIDDIKDKNKLLSDESCTESTHNSSHVSEEFQLRLSDDDSSQLPETFSSSTPSKSTHDGSKVEDKCSLAGSETVESATLEPGVSVKNVSFEPDLNEDIEGGVCQLKSSGTLNSEGPSANTDLNDKIEVVGTKKLSSPDEVHEERSLVADLGIKTNKIQMGSDESSSCQLGNTTQVPSLEDTLEAELEAELQAEIAAEMENKDKDEAKKNDTAFNSQIEESSDDDLNGRGVSQEKSELTASRIEEKSNEMSVGKEIPNAPFDPSSMIISMVKTEKNDEEKGDLFPVKEELSIKSEEMSLDCDNLSIKTEIDINSLVPKSDESCIKIEPCDPKSEPIPFKSEESTVKNEANICDIKGTLKSESLNEFTKVSVKLVEQKDSLGETGEKTLSEGVTDSLETNSSIIAKPDELLTSCEATKDCEKTHCQEGNEVEEQLSASNEQVESEVSEERTGEPSERQNKITERDVCENDLLSPIASQPVQVPPSMNCHDEESRSHEINQSTDAISESSKTKNLDPNPTVLSEPNSPFSDDSDSRVSEFQAESDSVSDNGDGILNENDSDAICENDLIMTDEVESDEKSGTDGSKKVSSPELTEMNFSESSNFCDSTVMDAFCTDDMVSQDSLNNADESANISKGLRKRILSDSEGDSSDSSRNKKPNGILESKESSENGKSFLGSSQKRPSDDTLDIDSKKLRISGERLFKEHKDKPSREEKEAGNECQTESLDNSTVESVKESEKEDGLSSVDISNQPTDLPFLRKLHKNQFSKMSRSDLEELILQKMCEAITERSVVGELRLRCQVLETRQEKEIEKFNKLKKQMTELTIVMKKYLDNQRINRPTPPIKVTRSVGLQVSPALRPCSATCHLTLRNRGSQQTAQPTNQFFHFPKQNAMPSKPDSSLPGLPSQAQQAKQVTPIKAVNNRTPRPASNVVSSTVPPALVPTVSTSASVLLMPGRPVMTPPRVQVPPLQQITPARPRFSIPTSNPSTLPQSTIQMQQKPSPIRQASPQVTTQQKDAGTDVEVIDIENEDGNKKTAGLQISPQQHQHQQKQAANAAAQSLAGNTGMTVRLISPTQAISTSYPNFLVQAQGGMPQKMIIASPPSGNGIKGNFKVVMKPGQGNVLIPFQSNGTAVTSSVLQIPTSAAAVQQIFTNAGGGKRTNTVAPFRQNSPVHPAPLPVGPTLQAQNPAWKLIPPRPSLKIQHQNNGIVLSWNMALGSQFADIESYQLFAYQEGPTPPSAGLWKKVGDVKALPLPMACTLTQFVEGHRYHFTVRAVDKHGRVGPFSQQGSIRLGN